eukprot:1184835-Prorocentrum_minimum.AAC.3
MARMHSTPQRPLVRPVGRYPLPSSDWSAPSPSLAPQVGAQTETELKEKKLRVEDALNATKAAVDEGIVIGGGCTLLKLANCIDDEFKASLANDEMRVGAEIIKRALPYSLRLIANNSGDNGAVVVDQVRSRGDNPPDRMETTAPTVRRQPPR